MSPKAEIVKPAVKSATPVKPAVKSVPAKAVKTPAPMEKTSDVKPSEVAAVTEAVKDCNKALGLNPPIDLNVGYAALKQELVDLISEIKPEDNLSDATKTVLKGLGWGTTKPKASRGEKKQKAPKVERMNRPTSVYKMIREHAKNKSGITAEALEQFSTALMTKINGKEAGAADRICKETLWALTEFGIMEKVGDTGAYRLI